MSNSSHEFDSLVKELQQSPDDVSIKQALVRRMPAMKSLAEENPLVMFKLAQIHSPTSAQYKQMMRQSANLGCTNAMLAVAQILMKSHVPADLKTAVHYLAMIERSKDSYMIEQSRALVNENPEVAALLKVEMTSRVCQSSLGFFNHQAEKKTADIVEMRNQAVL